MVDLSLEDEGQPHLLIETTNWTGQDLLDENVIIFGKQLKTETQEEVVEAASDGGAGVSQLDLSARGDERGEGKDKPAAEHQGGGTRQESPN